MLFRSEDSPKKLVLRFERLECQVVFSARCRQVSPPDGNLLLKILLTLYRSGGTTRYPQIVPKDFYRAIGAMLGEFTPSARHNPVSSTRFLAFGQDYACPAQRRRSQFAEKTALQLSGPALIDLNQYGNTEGRINCTLSGWRVH